MAQTNLTTLSPVLPDQIDSELASHIVADAPLLAVLPVVYKGGDAVTWVNYFSGKSVTKGFADGYDVQPAEFSSNEPKLGVLSWAVMRSPFKMDQIAVDAAFHTNGGAQALEDQFWRNLVGAFQRMTKEIGKDLYTGNGAFRTVVGIGESLEPTGSTYGGINVSTYTEMQATVKGNSGTPRALTEAILADANSDVEVKSGRSVELWLMNPKMAAKYSQLLGANVIINANDDKFNVGFNTNKLHFQGTPVMKDRNVPNGTVIGITRDALHIQVMTQAPRKDVVSFMVGTALNAKSGDVDGSPIVGIPMYAVPLGVDANAVQKWDVQCASFQLVNKFPEQCVIIKDLTQ